MTHTIRIVMIGNSVQTLESGVTHRAIYQRHDITTVLAFLDQAKNGFESREISINDIRGMVDTDINTRRS
jgi:hypothetical protein